MSIDRLVAELELTNGTLSQHSTRLAGKSPARIVGIVQPDVWGSVQDWLEVSPFHDRLSQAVGAARPVISETLLCLVIDTEYPGFDEVDAWMRVARSLPALIWVLVRNTPSSVARALRISDNEPMPMLICGEERLSRDVADLASRWRRLRRMAEVNRHLSSMIRRAPSALAIRLLALFASSRCATCAKDLAASAGVSRRTLDRWVRSAGLASPRRLVCARRVLEALDDAHVRKSTLTRTARAHGFASAQALRRGISEFFDIPPSQLSADMGRNDDAAQVARQLIAERRRRVAESLI